MTFRPMLAAEAPLDELRFPLYASAKLDGVRALRIGGRFLSRSLKPLPNRSIQARFDLPDGLDGELIVGEPTAKDCYRQTVSAVMSEAVIAPATRYFTFDNFSHPQEPFRNRRIAGCYTAEGVVPLLQHEVRNLEELLALEEELLTEGYEGLILRDPDSPYKFGRSTAKQQWMLKLKRFRDDEAEVVGFEELQHNANAAELDERGYTKRSSHQENKQGGDMLGALVVAWNGLQLKIGTGFTAAERQDFWQRRHQLLGAQVKFKYFQIGMKDLPRHPVFLGWRQD